MTPRSGDQLREEFRAAQRRRLLTCGVVVLREAELPEPGPKWSDTPAPEKVE